MASLQDTPRTKGTQRATSLLFMALVLFMLLLGGGIGEIRQSCHNTREDKRVHEVARCAGRLGGRPQERERQRVRRATYNQEHTGIQRVKEKRSQKGNCCYARGDIIRLARSAVRFHCEAKPDWGSLELSGSVFHVTCSVESACSLYMVW